MNFLLILLNIFFVSFADKPVQATPALSPRAVEQRAKWNIATDELDYPVHAAYLDSLRQHGATICHTSRWMNGATCSMDERCHMFDDRRAGCSRCTTAVCDRRGGYTPG